MKAMVLAAGLGTRLRPFTDERPKALAEVGGRTLLEITLARLRRFGVREVIVNVHHFAGQVVDYLRANDNFGMQIAISREDELLLDTGGGLLYAANFFLRDAESADEPFLLHNVDVLSDIDLREMAEFHRRKNVLATLAVQQRESSRLLLFDAGGRLCGRRTAGKADEMASEFADPPRSKESGCGQLSNSSSPVQAWAFTGIHVLSPRIFGLLREGLLREGLLREAPARAGQPEPSSSAQAFPIIPEYLRLAGGGEKIIAFPAGGCYWRDLGTAASLQQAAEDIAHGRIEL
jgi:NDP-sugar pyrophosphorylase family protein